MKQILMSIAFIISFQMIVKSQRIPQVPDSVRKKYQLNNPRQVANKTVDLSSLNQDSLIKIKLVQLASNNPVIIAADANIRIAGFELDKARNSWLSSVSAGANINEFVINNSPAANFFPKYNLGLTIPLNIISKTKSEKNIASQNIIINTENKKERLRMMKTMVLSLYEEYKEKKELVRLQKIAMDDDYQAYLAAQKNYADGNIELEDMNRIYKSYIGEQGKLITKDKELNIAIIQLEELINMPLEMALNL
jgi:outer membrane protein TolC